MKRTLLLAAAFATLAMPLTATAQTVPAPTSGSACRMVDSTNPNNWLEINATKGWTASVNGVTYSSTGFDRLTRYAADPTQVNFKDATGITSTGTVHPSLRLTGRYVDGRDKARFELKDIDGTTDVKMTDPAAPLDSNSFDCSAIGV